MEQCLFQTGSEGLSEEVTLKLKPGILDGEDSGEREGIACAKGLRQE